MSFAFITKALVLLLWPLVFLVIMYFNDKEKFKAKWKRFKLKDW